MLAFYSGLHASILVGGRAGGGAAAVVAAARVAGARVEAARAHRPRCSRFALPDTEGRVRARQPGRRRRFWRGLLAAVLSPRGWAFIVVAAWVRISFPRRGRESLVQSCVAQSGVGVVCVHGEHPKLFLGCGMVMLE